MSVWKLSSRAALQLRLIVCMAYLSEGVIFFSLQIKSRRENILAKDAVTPVVSS